MADAKLFDIRNRVEFALSGLSEHFHSDCKLTFVMRKPGSDDCFMVISDDNLEELAALLVKKGQPRPKYMCKKCGNPTAEKQADIQGWDGFCDHCGSIAQSQVGERVDG